MKQRKHQTADSPSNDNAPISANSENTGDVLAVSHVYVRQDENMHLLQTDRRGDAPIRKVWQPSAIFTDLPDNLPILPEEIALIRGFMGELVSMILANDNDPL